LNLISAPAVNLHPSIVTSATPAKM
jgi:hypothetical protein